MALVAIPQPYDFDLSTERFRAFGQDLACRWYEGALHRILRGREVRIAAAPGGVEVDPHDAGIGAEVRLLLGIPFDLAALAAWAAREDATLAEVVTRLRGFRPPLQPDPWEALVTSITAQQVSLHAAFAIRGRLVERYGVRYEHAWAFPSRETLAEAREEEIVAGGFSRRKAEYLVALARSDLDLAGLAALPDNEVRATITAERGLGEWTADWFLARHLARPHAWPAGDLALRKAVSVLYGDGRGDHDRGGATDGRALCPVPESDRPLRPARRAHAVRIRRATEADLPVLERFWRDFLAEIPEAAHIVVDPVAEVAEIAETVRDETALVAEDDAGEVLGYALARRHEGRVARLTDLYSPRRLAGAGWRKRSSARSWTCTEATARSTSSSRSCPLECAGAIGLRALRALRETQLELVAPINTLAQRLAAPRRRDVVRLDPRPDRRRRSRRACRAPVRAAPAGTLARLDRLGAAERLGHGLRRRLRP